MCDSCSGDGLWNRAARGCVTCSSWKLCWLSAQAEHDVNPACPSPTQPLETVSNRSQAPRWFCLKKIRKLYQQTTDRQSSSAKWKTNWSSKTATCCSSLLSKYTVSEHFSSCMSRQAVTGGQHGAISCCCSRSEGRLPPLFLGPTKNTTSVFVLRRSSWPRQHYHKTGGESCYLKPS